MGGYLRRSADVIPGTVVRYTVSKVVMNMDSTREPKVARRKAIVWVIVVCGVHGNAMYTVLCITFAANASGCFSRCATCIPYCWSVLLLSCVLVWCTCNYLWCGFYFLVNHGTSNIPNFRQEEFFKRLSLGERLE